MFLSYFNLKAFFAAVIKIFSTFPSALLISLIGASSIMYSRMSIWRSGERKISLNFDGESFSQINCIGKRDNELCSSDDLSSEMFVLIFSQVIIEL